MMILLTFLLFFLLPILARADEYYVSSSTSGPCPVVECYNLSYYVSASDQYFTDDTILYFMEGTHLIEDQLMIVISDVTNLTLAGWNTSGVYIECLGGRGGMGFFQCTDITLTDITISGCGAQVPNELIHSVNEVLHPTWQYLYGPSHSYHTLFFAVVEGMRLNGLTVQYGKGRAVSAANAFNVTIADSLFQYNNIDTFTDPHCAPELFNVSCYGGNVHLTYIDLLTCPPLNESYYYIDISHSSFIRGVDIVNAFLNAGLGILMGYSANYGIDINIDSVHIEGNTALRGANFDLTVVNTVHYHTLTVTNMTSIYGNSIYQLPLTSSFVSIDESYGAGFLYHTSIFLIETCTGGPVMRYATHILNISDSFVAHNVAQEGAGIMISTWPGLNLANRFIMIHNVQTFRNGGEMGVGLLINQYSALQPESHLHIELINLTVNENRLIQWSSSAQLLSTSAILLAQAENVTFINVNVYDNTITGLHTYNTILTIKETNTTFTNNSALEGGGIFLRGTSSMIFQPPGNLFLVNNTAEYGGGIYFQRTSVEDDRPLCFFQIDDYSSASTGIPPNTHLYSINNTASVAGDFIYSSTGAILTCRLTVLFDVYTSPTYAFNRLVIYDEEKPFTTLSSTPVRVCFCNDYGIPECSKTSRLIDVIPGTTYNITVATVGFEDGLTPGLVNYVHKVNGTIIQNSVFRILEGNCTTSSHLLRIYGDNTTITLTASQSTVPDHNYPITLGVNILPCPDGYKFSPNTGECLCNEFLQLDSIMCNSTTWSVTRSSNNWITYNSDDNCTIVYTGCPFDYCNTSSVTFPLSSPDIQCINNRIGLLCGKCAPGYSIILGSNACQKCSNSYLSLILVFIVAGIALVLFIFALNLTVTTGTINGLIFYANIVKINNYVFFPNGPVPVLSQFISWINLDLGFEICFYDGLDTFAKTWLQFAFPLYIASIVVGIIILCHYSQTVSKLAGNNAVPVLATLILLSYTKVLLTIISAMQMGVVNCDGSLHSVVWLLDGTVNYFSSKHGVLFLFSVAVFLLIAIPYTGLILFIPLIEKRTPRKLKWLSQLKPYFDATCGEMHDENRYWPGLLLLVRLVLAIIVPFTSSDIDTAAILLATILVMTIVWNLPSGNIYKKRYLDILESWHFVNLGFVSILTLSGIGHTGIIISTSLIFGTFLLIVVLHTWKRIRKFQRIKEHKISQRSERFGNIVLYLSRRKSSSMHSSDSMMNMQSAANKRKSMPDLGFDASVSRRRETLLYTNESTGSTLMDPINSGVNTNDSNMSFEIINSPVSPGFKTTDVFLVDEEL